jgi:(p)ppGpp synthase/HD superfamily hydrolase
MSQDKSISKEERREKCYFLLKTESNVSTVIIKCCDRIDNITTAHDFSQEEFRWYLFDTLNLIKNLGNISMNTDLGIHNLLLFSFASAKNIYFKKYGKHFDFN